jgi:hypothetical protein
VIHTVHASHVDSALNWKICVTQPTDEYVRDIACRKPRQFILARHAGGTIPRARASPYQIQSNFGSNLHSDGLSPETLLAVHPAALVVCA